MQLRQQRRSTERCKATPLAQAEVVTKSLPPAPLDLGDEGEDPHYIDMTLDFLIDELADTMHEERKVRGAFNRDIGNEVLFIKDGKLLFIKASGLRPSPTAKLTPLRCARAGPTHCHPRRAPPEQAFDLWKQHVLGDQQPD